MKKIIKYTISAAVLASMFQITTPTYAERIQKSQIEEQKAQVEDIETQLQQLGNRITIAMDKVQKLNEQIQGQQVKIEQAKVEIEQAQKDLDTHKEIYSERLKSIQAEGKTSIATYAEFLLTSNDLSQFLTRFSAISMIIEKDTDMLNSLKEKQQALEAAKEKLQTELADLNKNKEQLAAEQKKIEEDKSKAERILAEKQSELSNLETEFAAQEERDRQERIAREEAARQARLAEQRAAQQRATQQVAQSSSGSSSKPAPSISVNVPASASADAIISYAKQFLGVPYVWGGSTPAGFDCSGFTSYVFRNAAGISLPRVSSDQQRVGTAVSLNDVQPGDLVFRGSPAYHVGIYIGGGLYIHAPQTGDVVKIAGFNPAKFTNARRVLQ
ncbi:C40 family peptidase [Neobacillus niacini]|uniref:C40 family peptidase n=1 Tax=Neobacillus niacini TaxID=86668 RepID=UPI0021CB2811|nr:C40 family peptidase [Neobacillus niacini]MCM3764970.1 NlpC/P60 family protein [Neobacillus niacini]